MSIAKAKVHISGWEAVQALVGFARRSTNTHLGKISEDAYCSSPLETFGRLYIPLVLYFVRVRPFSETLLVGPFGDPVW